MTLLRRLGSLVLLAFIVAIAVWASRPWSDWRQLDAPPEVEPQSIEFRCGPPLGEDTVRRAETTGTSYPLVDASPPCQLRQERRVLAFVNVGLATAGLLILLLARRKGPGSVATSASPESAVPPNLA